jgi:small subunit ribosomal protein S7
LKLNAGTNAPETEHLDDATLEQIFYGGRTNPTEADGGLTEAQEDVLYREGTIPAPSEAEALVAASETAVGAAATAETPGLKFPLPTGPFGPEFNQKKRYHPVVDQLTRLLMRDGKLGVAQRVRDAHHTVVCAQD